MPDKQNDKKEAVNDRHAPLETTDAAGDLSVNRETGRTVYRRLSLDEETNDAPPNDSNSKRMTAFGKLQESIVAAADRAASGATQEIEAVTNAATKQDKDVALKTLSLAAIAKTAVPLFIGFLCLLGLVFALGTWSVYKLNEVTLKASDLQRQRSVQFKQLLDIKNALADLNTEARLRSERAARGGIQPLFSTRLNSARNEAVQLLKDFSRTPYADTPDGKKFDNELDEFIAIAQDERRYSLEGFAAYARVDSSLEDFLRQENQKQTQILAQTEQLQREAARGISNLRWSAFAVGAIIALFAMWDVLRRFQMLNRSLAVARRERQFSSQVLEGMINAIATLDDKRHLQTHNEAFRQLFPQASIGAPVAETTAESLVNQIGNQHGVQPNDQNHQVEYDAMRALKAVTKKPIDTAEYRGRFVFDQSLGRTFDAYVAPLKIDDERGAILSFVDVTEAARAENQLRRRASLTAVGQATAQIAHEIKNPLGSIRLGVALLRDMVKDPDAISTVDLVERGIEHLNKLTVDVTQFSSQRELDLEVNDVGQVISESLDLVRDRLDEKHIKIETKLSPEPLTGMIDSDALRQVFVNLIANAVDASRENGAIEIAAELKIGNAASTPSRAARVSIIDYGSGMKATTRERLFEPFFTTKKRGTGLGMAITKKIIEQHGGEIKVESEEGEGTCFIIELPLQPDTRVEAV